MISRFVVVPAIPTETRSIRNGIRYYCETAPIGFDIYDNEEKRRLKLTYQSRAEAENECQQLVRDLLHSMLLDRESALA